MGAVVVRHAQQDQDPQGSLYDDDDAPPVVVVSAVQGWCQGPGDECGKHKFW